MPSKWNKINKTVPICSTGIKDYRFRTEIGKELKDVNGFSNANIKNKDMITYFNDENHRTKEKHKK